MVSSLLREVDSLTFLFLSLPLGAAEPLPPPLGEGEAEASSSLLPLAAEEVECLPLPLAAAEPLPPPLRERMAEPVAWTFPARGGEHAPLPAALPAEEATALAWRRERRGGVLLVLVALGERRDRMLFELFALGVAEALGVEPGVGPGDV